jgi:glutamate synthase (NADPH/NADH) small chain
LYSLATSEFLNDGDGQIRAIRVARVERSPASGAFEPVPGSEMELEADLVLLALGFLGPEQQGVVGELGCALTERGNIAVGQGFATSVEGVFACGDCQRGQSLIVWAIAEGRSAAAAVDAYLMGTTDLPAPLRPGAAALV